MIWRSGSSKTGPERHRRYGLLYGKEAGSKVVAIFVARSSAWYIKLKLTLQWPLPGRSIPWNLALARGQPHDLLEVICDGTLVT